MRRLAARPARLGAVLLAALALTSCVRVPDNGPVVVARGKAQPPPVQAEFNKPKGPQPGQSAEDVVIGFLDAMTATPLQTNTAQEFLARHAQQQWNPQRVVAYSYHTPARGTQHVVVRLRGADQVGARGQWQGQVSPSGRRLVFPMTREDNEWRIAAAPDALLVPSTFFDQQYQDADLYFFDPSGKILVPEPVHVPQGSQLTSALVRALLHGPSRSLAGVARTFIPAGLTLGLSVPVGNDGVADVTLKGPDPGPLSRKTVNLVVAQLAWTLRQDPEVTSFRLTIADHSVSDATGNQVFKVHSTATDRYDPAVSLASSQIYGLRAGRLVSGQIEHPTKVDGPFGNGRLGIRQFAVSLDGTEVAGVTSSSLLVGPVLGASQPTPELTGSGLQRPSWDFADRLWNIQDGPSGAEVVYVDRGRTHPVKVPGITGGDVRRFLVSRDGSRIVAVLRGPASDRIVVSRLRYNANDRAVRGTRARPIRWVSGGTTRVSDIGWTSPTTIAVLDQVSGSQAEVRILNVDGSTPPGETAVASIPGVATRLATSPVATQTPYAVLASGLYNIAQVDPTRPLPTPHLHRIAYAG
ncbi:MAG TPA: LpqB family beta-propeller domain-containing protein [Nocardioides sp.]|jgi:lipoprotein LpqB-like beta-propeller protein/sporulation and spore germination protein|nr:LpqB family beta-propeller domain-containing protein [Nocardioides sp.]